MIKIMNLCLVLAMFLVLVGCSEDKPAELNIVHDPNADALSSEGLGHFADITDADGYVVGTQYYSEPQEIVLTSNKQENAFMIHAELKELGRPPFSETTCLNLGQYEIIGSDGKPVALSLSTESGIVEDGAAMIQLKIPQGESLPEGPCILKIYSLFSEKMGDQPLEIFGKWSVTF